MILVASHLLVPQLRMEPVGLQESIRWSWIQSSNEPNRTEELEIGTKDQLKDTVQ